MELLEAVDGLLIGLQPVVEVLAADPLLIVHFAHVPYDACQQWAVTYLLEALDLLLQLVVVYVGRSVEIFAR